MPIAHATVAELAYRAAGEVVTVRGRELPVGATAGDARALFASRLASQPAPVVTAATPLAEALATPAARGGGVVVVGAIARATSA